MADLSHAIARDLTPVDFQNPDNSTSLFLSPLKDDTIHEKTTTSEPACLTDDDFLSENSFRSPFSQSQIANNNNSSTSSELKRNYLSSVPSTTTNSMFHDLTPGSLWTPQSRDDIQSQTMAISFAGNTPNHFHAPKANRIPNSNYPTSMAPQGKRNLSGYSFLPIASSTKPSTGWNATNGQQMSGWQHFAANPTWQFHSTPNYGMTNQVSVIGQRNGVALQSNGRPSFPPSTRHPRGQRSTLNGLHSRSVCTANLAQGLQGMSLSERPIDGTVVGDSGILGISGNLTELSNSLYMVRIIRCYFFFFVQQKNRKTSKKKFVPIVLLENTAERSSLMSLRIFIYNIDDCQ
jgi:hypothetical protein